MPLFFKPIFLIPDLFSSTCPAFMSLVLLYNESSLEFLIFSQILDF